MDHNEILKQQIWEWFVNDLKSCFEASRASQAQNKLFPGGLCFPAAMTIFSVLEMVTGYYTGKDPCRSSVASFISKYMGKYCPQLENTSIVDKWYEVFRNGLTHQWSPKAGGVAMNPLSSEIFIFTSNGNEEIPILIVPTFFEIFKKALKDYEYDLDSEEVLREKFKKRHNQLMANDFKVMRSFRALWSKYVK